MKVRVAAFLFWDLGVEYIRVLLNAGCEVVAVVTPPTEGRQGLPPEYSVERAANDSFLPVYKPALQKVNSPDFVRVLRRLSPDLIVACYYPKVFSRDVLAIARLGCLNTHPSLLPKDRGMFPVFMPVVRRDRVAGITIHFLDPGVDTGDIAAQRSFELCERETGVSVTEKLRSAAGHMLAELLPLMEAGKAPRTPQNHDDATYFNWKTEVHARVSWTHTTEEIDALIRALGGLYGGAHSFLGNRRVVFHAARPADPHLAGGAGSAVPGEVTGRSGSGYLVRTGDGVIEVTDMAFEDGARPSVEETLCTSRLRVVFS